MPINTPHTVAGSLRNIAATIAQPVWHGRHPGPLTAAHAGKLRRLAGRVEHAIRDDDPRLDAFTPHTIADPAGGHFLTSPPEVDRFLAEVPEHWSPGRFLSGLAEVYRTAPPPAEDTIAQVVRALTVAAEQTAAGRISEHAVNADGQLVVRYVRRPVRGL
ncbi:hypothetical protein FF36_05332 [Frankia torreyi]|uniref:Uncharacterized protein n=1 Tax=Frankia torreyi TaxID=1856 RepID=A0A0D8B7V7_9ACTN|nr:MULTISPECIES: hypothetical protein [Frankia]KJE20358.1 hypothetical protein FF36_05332 [Frankia torreyi]KQM02738.1 hypothetical protein FF86_105730 [Frankia sp. CpI1-P]